jgi:capsule polysaccharide export protein KpsE/RkpR
MADEAQGTTTPATTETQTSEPKQEKPRVQADALPPEALKARLESAKEAARRELLSELGVSDPKDAKAALEELRKRQDAERSEIERLNAKTTELEGKAKLADAYAAVIAARASAEMDALPEQARLFVQASAGDDPARRLATIDQMRATGMLMTQPAKPAETPASTTPAAPPPPANTAPRAAAPAVTSAPAITDHRAEYERLMAENPFAAAAYAERHPRDVFLTK